MTLEIPNSALWALLTLFVGALAARSLRVSRERLKKNRNVEASVRDSGAIHEFLLQSKKEGRFEFRSTEAIASHTKLTQGRVEELCASHPNIKRNEKDRQTWHLTA